MIRPARFLQPFGAAAFLGLLGLAACGDSPSSSGPPVPPRAVIDSVYVDDVTRQSFVVVGSVDVAEGQLDSLVLETRSDRRRQALQGSRHAFAITFSFQPFGVHDVRVIPYANGVAGEPAVTRFAFNRPPISLDARVFMWRQETIEPVPEGELCVGGICEPIADGRVSFEGLPEPPVEFGFPEGANPAYLASIRPSHRDPNFINYVNSDRHAGRTPVDRRLTYGENERTLIYVHESTPIQLLIDYFNDFPGSPYRYTGGTGSDTLQVLFQIRPDPAPASWEAAMRRGIERGIDAVNTCFAEVPREEPREIVAEWGTTSQTQWRIPDDYFGKLVVDAHRGDNAGYVAFFGSDSTYDHVGGEVAAGSSFPWGGETLAESWAAQGTFFLLTGMGRPATDSEVAALEVDNFLMNWIVDEDDLPLEYKAPDQMACILTSVFEPGSPMVQTGHFGPATVAGPGPRRDRNPGVALRPGGR